MDLSAEFTSLIVGASDGALPRPAVEAALRDAVAAPAPVLLRGEPGSGKTCLVARALRERGGLHHFLRRGHAEATLWRDPHAFLLSVGLQLKAAHGDELFAGSVAIDVDQLVHELDEDATLTGVRVERLIASPFAPLRLRVRQKVDHAAGAVAAVTVVEMVDEVHRIPLPVLREIALLAPLRRLRQRDAAVHVVLWVDALDEEGGAADGIGALLPGADELAALGNLGLVVASRPGPAAQHLADAGATLVDLDGDRFDDDHRAFIAAFVAREATDPAVQAALDGAGVEAAALGSQLAGPSGARPLVLAQGFAAVRRGELPSLLAGGLPQGLDAIHARLADTLARPPGFAAEVRPLLAVLCVARQALSTDELARFAGIGRDGTRRGLDALAPFLDATADGHALYHRTFQETLVDPAHREAPWSVVAADANDHVAAACWPAPKGLDAYGLDHFASHLADGGAASRARLLDLPDRAWRRRRRERAGSLWPVLADLRLALLVARALPPGRGLPAAARLALRAGAVHDAERAMPPGLAGATVRAGRVQRAIDSVSPEMHVDDQVARLTEIVAARVATAPGEGSNFDALTRELLRRALSLIQGKPDGWALAELLEACPADAAGEIADWIDEAGELVRSLPPDWRRPRAVAAVARLQAVLDGDSGRAWFEAALKEAERLTSSRTLDEGRIARAWLAFDPEAAAELLQRLHLVGDADSVRTVLDIGRVMEANGVAGALVDLAGQVRTMLEDFGDPYKRALGEAALGRALIECGDADAARVARQQAEAALARIGGDHDPERRQQNRPSMASDAVLAIADLAVELGAPDAAQWLEAAWTAFGADGFHNGDATELAELQRRLEPALLEVQVDGVASLGSRLEMRLAALPALFESDDGADRELALRWHAEAVLEAERDAEPSGVPGYLLDAALRAAPASRLDAARARADAALTAADAVAVQLEWLSRLLPAHLGDALADTVARWATSVTSVHRVFDLPGWIVGLPAEAAEDLLARPQPVAPPAHAALLELALGALAERLGAGRGCARFDAALADLDAAATRELPESALRAFAAGAWGAIDARRAQSLWCEALAWLNRSTSFASDALHQHEWLMILVNAREAADPDGALAVLLACREPLPEPGTMLFVVPGPAVDPMRQTGMSPRDVCVARQLARAGLATDDLEPAALRALALVESATASPSTRLAQVRAALDATEAVEPPSLAALLQAKAVRALATMGARRLAAEHGAVVLESVRAALPVFGTSPMSGYSAALGELAAAALVAGDAPRAADLVFEASRLGVEGVDRALAPLAGALAAADEAAWDALLAESDRAWAD